MLTLLASPSLETLIALLAAPLVFIPLHELLHAAVAQLLGSRVAVRFLPRYLGITTLFLDPLPLWRAALVYLAPLLERLRPEVEGLLGCRVARLEPFKAMVSESGDAVAEYLAVLEGPMASGEASVKLIHAENPVEALREYYEWERRAAGRK